MSGTPSRDEFKRLFEHVQSLDERVDSLEDENDDLQSRLSEADKKADAAKQALAETDELSSTLSDVEDTIESIQSELDEQATTDDDLTERLDELREEVRVGRQEVERSLSRTKKRVTGIEHHLDLEESDVITAVGPDDSELAHLSILPDEIRENEIDSVNVTRALEIYDNFDKWSRATKRGYLITSGELKRYLNEDLEWNQIYRVMEAFNDKTSAKYAKLESAGSEGKKCLIQWKPEYRPN